MAFSKGTEATGGAKRYVGLATCFVKGVNPTKEQLAEIYNAPQEKDPVYTGEIDVNGVKVPYVRLEFVLQTDPTRNSNIETTTRMSITLRNAPRANRDGSKVQVIDKYGRTAWVDGEQFAKNEIPVYKNGPARIDAGYRAAFVGEEQLINFLKAYLNIPNVDRYVNGEWVPIANPADAEARLDHIEDYFKGDVSEIREILSFQPNNRVKVLFGVRTTEDNHQYQAFYTETFLRANASDYSRLDAEVADRKEAGGYATTDFGGPVAPLREFVDTPSEIPAEAPAATMPSPWFKNS